MIKFNTLLARCLIAGIGFCHVAFAAGPSQVSASAGWARWLPSELPAAGYLTLANHGKQAVNLVSVTSPDYGDVMLHQSISNGSTEKMVMVPTLPIPAGGQVAIAPHGYHLMLMKPTHKIAPGDTIHVELKFSDGAVLDVPLAVKPPSQID